MSSRSTTDLDCFRVNVYHRVDLDLRVFLGLPRSRPRTQSTINALGLIDLEYIAVLGLLDGRPNVPFGRGFEDPHIG